MTKFERTLFIHSIPIDNSENEIINCCIARAKGVLEVLEALQQDKKERGKNDELAPMEMSNDAFIDWACDKFHPSEWNRLCDLLAE